MGISLVAAVASLYGLSRCLSLAWYQWKGDDDKEHQKLMTPREREKRRLLSAIDFIFANILLQCIHKIINHLKNWVNILLIFVCSAGPIKAGIGNMSKRKSLVIRIMTGAWCLSCFVLITAYSSVLVSLLTEPEMLNKPIIDSIDDLIKHPEIRVTVKKGWGPDVNFQVFYISKINFLQATSDNEHLFSIANVKRYC